MYRGKESGWFEGSSISVGNVSVGGGYRKNGVSFLPNFRTSEIDRNRTAEHTEFAPWNLLPASASLGNAFQ